MSVRAGGPPRLARMLLLLLLRGRGPEALVGDLDEEYRRFIRPTHSRLRADLWYWTQVLGSLPAAWRLGPGGGSWSTELRQATRLLRRRPTFTLAAVGTLALGLGVNTAVFAVVHAVLMQPLPFHEPDRLVRPFPDDLFFLGSHDLEALAERTELTEWAGWGRSLYLFEGENDAEEVRGARVSWNHFQLLGSDPVLGRGFVREDAEAGDAIVLAHGLWQRRFGGDPGILDRTVTASGRSVRVVGVMGPGHVPLEFDWQAWSPLPLDPALSEGMGMAAQGRLREGVEPQEAEAELVRAVESIWADQGHVPTERDRAGLRLEPLDDWLLGEAHRPLFVLMGAVALILLLAGANVVNLLLAQTGRRAREFDVRMALGGDRSRLVRQLLSEALVLGVLASLVALIGAAVTLESLATQLPADLPRATTVGLSGPVVLFTGALALVLTLVAGLVPAFRVARSHGPKRASGGRGATVGRRGRRLRSTLVGVEVALSVMLVLGAGLMIRTVLTLRSVDPGFAAEGVVTVRPAPPASRYASDEDVSQYYGRVVERLEALPGVTAIGGIQFLPMTSGGWWSSFRGEGTVRGPDQNRPSTAMRVVMPGYFGTMEQEVTAGRALEWGEVEGDEIAAVVNETLARQAFPEGDPVGRLIWLGSDESSRARVVGVVEDVRQSDLRTESHPELYLSFERQSWRRMHLVMRTGGDPAALLPAVAAAVRAVDSGIHLEGPRVMTDIVRGTFSDTRLLSSLLTLFGFVALGLGAVGVYGVAAQVVGERQREIGIRLALGAESGSVIARTVGQGLVPVIAGLGIGVAGAWGSTRIMSGLVFGVEPHDPWTFALAPSVLLMVALASLWIPARRAGHVDPVATLREE